MSAAFDIDDTPSNLPRDDDGHVLGYRIELNNSAELRATQAPKPMLGAVDYDKLPTSLGVAEWMKIEDQGQIGSCQGNAQTSCLELAAYHDTKGKVFQFNRMFAYLATQKVDGIRGDNGSTMSGGAKSAATNGMCPESLWAYPGSYPRGGWQAIPQKCWDEAKKTTLVSHRVMESYEEVVQWLANGVGGVAIGISWNNSMSPDSNGCIRSYRNGGGGHVLALLDWNKQFKDPQGRPYLDMFNSWGQWGYKGRAFILPAVVDRWCKECDVIGYANVAGPDIKPRGIDWLNHGLI
jgi:hypothetical protein